MAVTETRMDGFKRVTLMLAMCVSVALSPADGSARGREVPERTAGIPGVSMRLGALRITSKVIELRCEVRNDSKQDIWLYSGGAQLAGDPDHATLYLDTDDETLIVLRRANLPKRGLIYANPYPVTYDRLPVGHGRAESLLVRLPAKVPEILNYGRFVTAETRDWVDGNAVSAADRAAMVATRLAFEIGFYTTEFLGTLPRRVQHGPAPVKYRESGEQVVVTGVPLGSLWDHEHAVRMTIEGTSIPYGDWLDFSRPEPNAVPGYPLFEISKDLDRKDVRETEPEPPLPELLEDLFHDSALELEEYRYAKRLFAIDEDLFDDAARAIANVYVDVANGRLMPRDLRKRLGKLGPRAYRERVLKALEGRGPTGDQKNPD